MTSEASGPHRWSPLSLATQLALLAVLPAILATTGVLVVTTRQYLHGLEALIHANAKTLAYQLAASAEASLAEPDRRALLHLAHAGISRPNARQVRIWSADGELLAEAEAPGVDRSESLLIAAPIVGSSGTPAGHVAIDIDLRELREAEHEGWRNVLAVMVASLAAVLIGGAYAARRISAPVRQLCGALDQLGAGRMTQVPETGAAEIRRLQQGFNRAAQALTDSRQEMETRIREATTELARRNARIERTSRAKTRLLAAASHDLRQPLHALTLFSDGLANGETDPMRLQRIMHMRECVASLDRLFSELLNLSQLDAGVLRPRRERFALDRVLADVSRTFRPVAEERSLRLVVRPTSLWVDSDYTMLTRILANLVSNALRHTATGGVLMAARPRGDFVQIDVIDTGVGIAPEHRAHVFEEFYQVDEEPPQSGEGRGLGLGLATVSRLTQLLGIPVELKSTVGRGTCMRLRVAAAEPDASIAPSEAGDDERALNGLCVLAIDDEPAILNGLQAVLTGWGCRTLMARTRAEALRQLDSLDAPPDVVLCDLLLRKGDDGLSVLKALATHPQGIGPRTVRLLVTGETKPERLWEASRHGIKVLYKPVAPAALHRAIVEQMAVVEPETEPESALAQRG